MIPRNNSRSPKHDIRTATTLAKSSPCPSCSAGNAPGRKFCGGCGHPLIEPCIQCQAETFVGERFCGACGVNLDEAAYRRADKAKVDLARVRQLADEARYQEALALVQPLAELKSNRLREVAQRSRELADEIVERRDHSKSRTDTALALASKAVVEHRWQEAVSAIQGIPALLRSREHQELLRHAEAALDELACLEQEIRAGIESDQTHYLLPKVERAIQLNPADDRMKELADRLRARRQHDACRLRDRLVQQSKALLKEYRYAQASQLLEEVPEDVRDEVFEQSYSRARELAFLWDCLRHSPVVAPVLADLGQRLMKLSPGDQKLGAIIAQLKERAGKKKRHPLEAVPWAKAPPQTALGPPIKRLATMGRINIDKVAANGLFVDNGMRFYAAAGAALQGLGLAAVQTNLLPKAEDGMFGQLRSWVKRPARGDVAWGIDLSASGLKALKLVRKAKSDAVAVEAFEQIDHATLLGGAASELQRRDILADTLSTFVKRNTIKDESICLVYPGTLTLGKFFEIPPVDEKKIDELMNYEARQQVPFPALYNFLQYAVNKRSPIDPADNSAPSPLSMLVDLGADAMHCIVCGDDTIWFRSFPRGSDELNKSLMRRFEVSFATAEQLKLNPAKARQISRLQQAWEPVFEHILKDARESLTAYENLHPERPIEQIWAAGGGFRVLGLHRYLLG